MSESFKGSGGRKVISRASAQSLGAVSHLLVNTERRAIAGLIIGKGKKAQIIDWDQVSGFGPDAVMVSDEGALRAPADDDERRACDGALELVGKRALSDTGNELGLLDDVTFDPATASASAYELRSGQHDHGGCGGGDFGAGEALSQQLGGDEAEEDDG